MVGNDAEKDTCVCCEAPKPGAASKKNDTLTRNSLGAIAPGGGFTFGPGPVGVSSSSASGFTFGPGPGGAPSSSVSGSGFTFGKSTSSNSQSQGFKFGTESTTSSTAAGNLILNCNKKAN